MKKKLLTHFNPVAFSLKQQDLNRHVVLTLLNLNT